MAGFQLPGAEPQFQAGDAPERLDQPRLNRQVRAGVPASGLVGVEESTGTRPGYVRFGVPLPFRKQVRAELGEAPVENAVVVGFKEHLAVAPVHHLG